MSLTALKTALVKLKMDQGSYAEKGKYCKTEELVTSVIKYSLPQSFIKKINILSKNKLYLYIPFTKHKPVNLTISKTVYFLTTYV